MVFVVYGIIVIRNGKIVWKHVLFIFFLELEIAGVAV